MASPHRRVVVWHQEGDPLITHCCLNCPSGGAIPEEDRVYRDGNQGVCLECYDLIMAGDCEDCEERGG